MEEWVVDSQVENVGAIATCSGLTSEGIVARSCVCLTIDSPCIWVASSSANLFVEWLVDSQAEGNDTIATCNSSVIEGVCTTSSKCHAIPIVRITSLLDLLFVEWLINSQVEDISAIATSSGLTSEGVVARSCVGLTVNSPSVSVASSSGLLFVEWLVNSQVEDISAIATCSGLTSEGVVARSCVGLTIDWPSVRVASCSGLLFVEWLVNSQVENMCAIATCSSLTSEGVVARGCVGLTIDWPSVRVASCSGLLFVEWLVDSQVEDIGAIATSSGLTSEGIVARSCVGLAIDSPCVSVASCSGLLFVEWLVDSQVEGSYAIATCSGLTSEGIIARSGVVLTIPCVRVASYNGLCSTYNR